METAASGLFAEANMECTQVRYRSTRRVADSHVLLLLVSAPQELSSFSNTTQKVSSSIRKRTSEGR